MLVAAETPGFKDFQDLLDPAGIQLNGAGACDIRVHNPDLFRCVVRDGTLGLGEAYMDGWWDCDRIDELFCRGLNAGLEGAVRKKLRFLASLDAPNLQSSEPKASFYSRKETLRYRQRLV